MSKQDMGNRILWAARLMAFLFIVLLVVVSLSSLSGAEPLSKKMPGLAIQLLPALAVLLVLLVYWRNTFSSGIAFMIVSVAFTVFFKTYTNIYSFLFLSIPLAIIALLFIGAEAATKNPVGNG
ncbi:MAG: hypothetical protein ABFD04_09680 [Syntrophomonas sp.]